MLATSTQAALAELLGSLGAARYAFTAVTPATHQRVIARSGWEEARDLRGVFGWNLPFRPGLLPGEMMEALRRAGGVTEAEGGLLRSSYRVASIGRRLFVHSAFPTDSDDAVFFGPDTYRFAAFLRAHIPLIGLARRVVDLGAGSGAGGIVAAEMIRGARLTLTDVNPAALRLAAVNAADAGVEAELVEGGLEAVRGPIDLVIANPPFIMDEDERAYRNGGGLYGAQLSLDWALEAARRMELGGDMLLYTGVSIVASRDLLHEALERALPDLGCALDYREIDPDIFGEELEKPLYRDVERIAAVGARISRRGS